VTLHFFALNLKLFTPAHHENKKNLCSSAQGRLRSTRDETLHTLGRTGLWDLAVRQEFQTQIVSKISLGASCKLITIKKYNNNGNKIFRK
jgi:hypothetical protein